jgi:hypothetical protein
MSTAGLKTSPGLVCSTGELTSVFSLACNDLFSVLAMVLPPFKTLLS